MFLNFNIIRCINMYWAMYERQHLCAILRISNLLMFCQIKSYINNVRFENILIITDIIYSYYQTIRLSFWHINTISNTLQHTIELLYRNQSTTTIIALDIANKSDQHTLPWLVYFRNEAYWKNNSARTKRSGTISTTSLHQRSLYAKRCSLINGDLCNATVSNYAVIYCGSNA